MGSRPVLKGIMTSNCSTIRVFCYWNLHKELWSIKALEGPLKGRVIARQHAVLLRDAQGKVSEAGRQRVLREQRKNVHAGIVGEWVTEWLPGIASQITLIGDRVTYNPYKYTEFIHTVDGSKFEGSAYALLASNRAVFVA